MTEFPADLLDEQPEDTQLVKDLRKQLREASKTIKTQGEEISSFRTKDRQGTLADILKVKGVSPKAAVFIPSSVEPTEDAVAAWLTEYGEALNITPTGNGGEGDGEAGDNSPSSNGADSATVEALRRAQATEQAGTSAGLVLGVDELNKTLSETDDMSFDEAIQFLADKGLSQPGVRS